MRITTAEDIETALITLADQDPRLCPVIAAAGPVPLRLSPATYASMAEIIISQLLSVAAANTIACRVRDHLGALTPENMIATPDDKLRELGLSHAKINSLKAVAMAVDDGMDLEQMCSQPTEDARAHLLAIKGIGPWTANIWLMSCAGHADIFPSGDVALQNAVAHAFAIEPRPTVKQLDEIAAEWRPHRAVAARLFWTYWRALNHGRESAPLSK